METRSKWLIGVGLTAVAASFLAYWASRKSVGFDLLPLAKQVVSADPSRLPCSTFTVRTLQRLKGWSNVEGSEWYADMQIFDRSRPFSNIEVNYTGRSGVPVNPLPGELKAGRWYLVQGWRSLTGPSRTIGSGDKGHAFFWFAQSPTHGYKLESDEINGPRLNGVRFSAASALTASPLPWQGQLDIYRGGVAVADVLTG